MLIVVAISGDENDSVIADESVNDDVCELQKELTKHKRIINKLYAEVNQRRKVYSSSAALSVFGNEDLWRVMN